MRFLILALLLTSCGGDGPEALSCEKRAGKKEQNDPRSPCAEWATPTPKPSPAFRGGTCNVIGTYDEEGTFIPTSVECDP